MQVEYNAVFSSVGTGETVSPVPTATDGVSLQVKISSAQILTIASGEVGPVSTSVEEQNVGVDPTGRAYALEPGEGAEISPVNFPANSPGSVEVVSEITRYRLQAQL